MAPGLIKFPLTTIEIGSVRHSEGLACPARPPAPGGDPRVCPPPPGNPHPPEPPDAYVAASPASPLPPRPALPADQPAPGSRLAPRTSAPARGAGGCSLPGSARRARRHSAGAAPPELLLSRSGGGDAKTRAKCQKQKPWKSDPGSLGYGS